MVKMLIKPLFAALALSLFVAPVAADEALPLLHLQPEVLDMGTVKEGEEAKATLFVRNNSDITVTITDIQTSCGCTAAEPKSRVLAPGAFTELEVRTDTAVKQGDVSKWIRVTDSAGHVATATLTLNVTENLHLIRQGRGLFDGQCAVCHFDPAEGKVGGKELYDAVCLMCHGEGGAGAYAPALNGREDATSLLHMISYGTGSPHMPGFAKEQGGPLSEEQLHELTGWLLSLD